MKIQSFKIREKLYESPRTVVYRSSSVQDGSSYILKMLNSKVPERKDIEKLRHEFGLLEQIHRNPSVGQGVIKAHGFIHDEDGCAIVFEDVDGVPLHALNRADLSIQDTIRLFIQIIEIVNTLHTIGFIHRDINPSNILFNPRTKQIKLIDFGLTLTEANHSQHSAIEGTLQYIAPEQSGRMNVPIDQRSDIYALGATMYKMVTDQVLFQDLSDPHEIIHQHLTNLPTPPSDLISTIPLSLSHIIMKCLSKNRDDRYQSCASLLDDLYQCLDIAKSENPNKTFDLGSNDIVFRIPLKLYGRSAEEHSLMENLCANSTDKPTLTLISGVSGSGKTYLIDNIRPKVSAFFIKGKCEQYRYNIPYQAIQACLQNFIHTVISKGDFEIRKWHQHLNQTFGTDISVIKSLIPEIELLCGDVPDAPVIDPVESKKRLKRVISDLIHAIADFVKCPVIFIDDIQWIDSDSVEMLEYIVGQNRKLSFSLLCSHRTESYVDMHLINRLTDVFKNNQCQVNQLTLVPLGKKAIETLIYDIFKDQLTNADVLIENILKTTQGNPLFAIKLLEYYQSTGVITQVTGDNQWLYTPQEFELDSKESDIVVFLQAYVQRLTEDAQKTLQIAAFLGTDFSPEMVALIDDQPVETVSSNLASAERYSLIIRNKYDSHSYQFVHDQIQKTAASLTVLDATQLHYKIGRTLYTSLTVEQIEVMIFDIANHLNASRELSEQNNTLKQLRFYNYRAALKAIQSSAFDLAFDYMSNILDLSPSLDELTLGVQAAMLSGNYDAMTKWITLARDKSKKPMDLIEVGLFEISSHMARNDHKLAIEKGSLLLKSLNYDLPDESSTRLIMTELLKTQRALPKRKYDSLYTLNPMKDKRILAIMSILSMLSSASYLADPQLFLVIAMRQVQLSTRYGSNPTTGIALSLYSLILCGVLGRYYDGYRIGSIASDMAETTGNGSIIARVKGHLSLFTLHWKDSMDTGRQSFYDSYKFAMAYGDTEYAAWGIFGYAEYGYFSGLPIDRVLRHFDSAIDVIDGLGQQIQLNFSKIFHRAISAWTGDGDLEFNLDHESLNDPSVAFYTSFHKMIFAYTMEDNDAAYNHAVQAAKSLDAVVSTICNPIFYFYDALILISKGTLNPGERRRLSQRIRRLKKWAAHSPETSGPLFAILEACHKGLFLNKPHQHSLFEAAIEKARSINAIHYEALAFELAGKYAETQGLNFSAKQYLSQAFLLYRNWGAKAKTKQLLNEYSHLLATQMFSGETIDMSQSFTETQSLDMDSIIKTTQALSEQMELGRLYDTFNELIIKNAGATDGALFIMDDDHLCLQSSWTMNQLQEFDRQSFTDVESIDTYRHSHPNMLPYDLIEYAWRAQKTVVFDRKNLSAVYSNDPYLLSHPTDSIMVIPILLNGQSIGALFLENKLTSGVFHENRLSAIKVIVGQLAISYENARLYEEMESKVISRTKELNDLSEEYYQLSIHDQLTQLYNRRKLDEVVQYEVDKLSRTGETLSIIILDIDHFKEINDNFGHQSGDRVLVKISSLLKDALRSTDTIGRWGGEEFLIICPDTDAGDAVKLAEMLRSLIETTNMGINNQVTSSFGVASSKGKTVIEALLSKADNALYEAKKSGRNRVETIESE